ncbi:hypothetical protein AVEN_52448-1 [Araneus ventricosus]|uniref:Uncharacterized protein n=1 Tax=Araneus ventricosus TaxID=182803 RepID=A0A4Y2CXE7_ARAVE|nr:hypothetical protein AVEN_52448-1 [Araneus ventricosus]
MASPPNNLPMKEREDCRGKIDCFRCALVGNSRTKYQSIPDYAYNAQPYTSDSRECHRRKMAGKIQKNKITKTVSYSEARKLITPQDDQELTPIDCVPLTKLQPSVTRVLWTISSSRQSQYLPLSYSNWSPTITPVLLFSSLL